ncbi:1-acyl-sn-glycerol-3-phosphate acyltransferase [Paroceanicella profunda]|uniref:1-acyl-sn-glycerol-3-phosphate acyltransferase n=1 Tax=Paroceanicella profunda TaxID=2579971 RepID=A0A5B8FZG5_9RHOB|nr:lysophospholipid acyltransferase family protein [Paroceanicella profunda]QDL92159.1 1-acyl-sn-glycerol-3-phosphate acyltransferase [Paroceanicella profunda]
MTLLRSLLFDACLYGLMAVMGLLCAPLALASRDGAYWAVKLYCRIILRLLRLICGLRTEVRGTPPVGEVLVVAKHQSFLDIIMLVACLERPKFVMKAELKWAPVLGWYAMRIGCAPVQRSRKGAAMRQMVQDVAGSADDPGQMVIYPQGTRVAPGVTAPFKIGAGVLYQRLGQNCVPMATNAGVFWGRNSLYRRPGTAVIAFLDPIPQGLPLADFMKRVSVEIEEASQALEAEAGFRPQR